MDDGLEMVDAIEATRAFQIGFISPNRRYFVPSRARERALEYVI